MQKFIVMGIAAIKIWCNLIFMTVSPRIPRVSMQEIYYCKRCSPLCLYHNSMIRPNLNRLHMATDTIKFYFLRFTQHAWACRCKHNNIIANGLFMDHISILLPIDTNTITSTENAFTVAISGSIIIIIIIIITHTVHNNYYTRFQLEEISCHL